MFFRYPEGVRALPFPPKQHLFNEKSLKRCVFYFKKTVKNRLFKIFWGLNGVFPYGVFIGNSLIFPLPSA